MSSPSSDSHDDDDAPSPLPPGWTRGYSNSQKRHYYVHAQTKHTQWHFPTASEASDPLMAKRRAEMNKKRQAEQSQSQASSSSSLGTIVSKIHVATPSTSTETTKVQQPDAKRRRRTTTTSSSSSQSQTQQQNAVVRNNNNNNNLLLQADSTSVAIIVPFRDLHVSQQRSQHLARFVPHMHTFLGNLLRQDQQDQDQQQHRNKTISNYHIYVVEQSNDDGRKFNRGKLLNIGFDLARKSGRNHDVYIFHDVDLLPQPDLGEWYAKFPKVPIHIARVWDRYSNNQKYFGGVVSFSSSDYKRINGYPNTFWGWGGEDDEMQQRLERLHIRWEWPTRGTLVDMEQMSLTEKLDFLRSNKEWKCQMKWEALKEHDATWKTNGLADLKYAVLKTESLDDTKRATKVTVDVKLNSNQWDRTSSLDYRFQGT